MREKGCDGVDSICERRLANAHRTIVMTTSPAEVVRNQAFEVGPRYSELEYIGEGAYGMVVCVDVVFDELSQSHRFCADLQWTMRMRREWRSRNFHHSNTRLSANAHCEK